MTTAAQPAKTTAKATPPPAKPAVRKVTPPPPMKPLPASPDMAINVMDLLRPAMNALYVLATAPEQTTSPSRSRSWESWVKRGVAQPADTGYTLTEAGRALCSLLWPDAPVKGAPAAKATARKPAKVKLVPVTDDTDTAGDQS